MKRNRKNSSKLSLKAFWEKVNRQLKACAVEELRTILRAMAQETLPTERQVFLDKLKRRQETAAAGAEGLLEEELLAEIDDWTKELKAAMKEADDWSEWSGYGYDEYYNDEDSLGPYAQVVESLEALFDRAKAAFDLGNFQLARQVYAKLFGEALQQEDDSGRGVQADDLELDQHAARGRYLRAVYETTRLADCPRVLFAQLQQVQTWLGGNRPRLNDLLCVSRRALPEREQFLSAWIAFLHKQKGGDADAWLREAVRLATGTRGLEELARSEGKQRPRAFLDWVTELEAEKKSREVIIAAQQALQTLPAKLPLRAKIADHLCAAASQLHEMETLRAGRWEAFAAEPTLVRLLDIWDAIPTKARSEQIRQAAEQVKLYFAHPSRSWDTEDESEIDDTGIVEVGGPSWIPRSILAHAYLLSRQWEQAHQLAARERVLGWSDGDNAQGLVLPFFLVLLSGKQPRKPPAQVADLWEQALDNTVGFDFWDDRKERALLKRLRNVYAGLISEASLAPRQQEEFLTWCLSVAKRRVKVIVGEQHRGSYGKAATLTAACAQVLRRRGHAREAEALITGIRNRFPRHRAFQDELNMAVQSTARG